MIDIGNDLQIEGAVKKSGKIRIYVRPEDIILSKSRIVSSARNVFKGKVIETSDFGDTVKLRIGAGKDFVVQITRRSFEEMNLNIGSEVFLTFKASAVSII